MYRKLMLLSLLTLAITFVSCGGDDDEDKDTTSDTTDTTSHTTSDTTSDVTDTASDTTDTTSDTAADVTDTADTADTAMTQPVTLQFAARVGAEDFACGGAYSNVGTAMANIEVNDFRFYVSNVRLIDDGGNEVAVTLTDDDLWQDDSVALLDFEDASMGCAANGTTETNSTVVGTVPEGTYTGVVFELGGPFEKNHHDVAAADAPLSVGARLWVWQEDRNFGRIDLT